MPHNVFTSYHHANDQAYKEAFVKFGEDHNIFNDVSVDTGEIDENLSDERIREIIRDEYLRDTSVTVLLAGTEANKRKHIDWEIYSSMINGQRSKRSGILVINLPETNCSYCTAAHGLKEKKQVHPEIPHWVSLTKSDYQLRYPYLPERIIDNLATDTAFISVIPWSKVNVSNLQLLINKTYDDRRKCKYDLSLPMRKHNS